MRTNLDDQQENLIESEEIIQKMTKKKRFTNY